MARTAVDGTANPDIGASSPSDDTGARHDAVQPGAAADGASRLPLDARRIHRLPRSLSQSGGAYLAGLLHDARQPITLLAALLQEKLQNKAAAVTFQYLFEELVEYARAGAGAAVQSSTFSLDNLIDDVITASTPSLMANPFRASVRPSQLVVHAPRGWVWRILLNLISNAIKHSGGDAVEVWGEHAGGRLILHVQDNGRGLRADQVHRLTDRLYAPIQASETDLSTLPHGHGLPTAQALAEAMGGELHLFSDIHGTHWRVILDVDVIEGITPAPAGADEDRLAGKLVAVLDDNVEIARTIARRLAARGATTAVFTDDFDLLAWLTHTPVKPDLYLLDFMLDGKVVTDSIGVIRRAHPTAAIVIVTARPLDEQLAQVQPPVPVMTKPPNEFFYNTLTALLSGSLKELENDPLVRMSGGLKSMGIDTVHRPSGVPAPH